MALAAATTPASAHAAHVHGVASLDVALDGRQLDIDLHSPLANLLGFEHAPRSAAEKQAAARLLQQLRQPAALFRFSPAAGCQAASANIDAPVLQPGAAAADEHGDVDAGFRFVCANPAALQAIDVMLFDAFRSMKSIKVQLLGPRGQQGLSLDPAQRRIAIR